MDFKWSYIYIYIYLHTLSKNHTGIKIFDLGWSVLLYSPYLPDFAPSDFYSFHSLQNDLNDKIFSRSKENIRIKLLELKTAEFFLRINKLCDKWQELIQNNGECIIDWN